MASANDLIAASKRHLYTGYSETVNRLDGAITSGATSLTLEFDLAGSIQQGTIIAIDTEEILVWAVSGKTLSTVTRGINGSTAASHSDDAIVTVQPKFSDFRVLQAINDDLRDLSGEGLFQIKTLNITFSPAKYTYDLTSVASDIIDVYEVRYKTPDSTKLWPRINKFVLSRNMDTTEYASGLALILYEAGFPGQPMRIRYKAPYGTFTAGTDDVATISGLHDGAFDLPPLGAAIRLMSGREIKRNFSEVQGEPRRHDEIPPGAITNSMRGLIALRTNRLNAEKGRLKAQYPDLLSMSS